MPDMVLPQGGFPRSRNVQYHDCYHELVSEGVGMAFSPAREFAFSTTVGSIRDVFQVPMGAGRHFMSCLGNP